MSVDRDLSHQAAERMRRHHAAMVAQLKEQVNDMARVAGRGEDWKAARRSLVDYVRGELLPHAQAEEATVYAVAAARPSLAPLIQVMVKEHQALAHLTDRAEAAHHALEALQAGAGLETLFTAHAAVENDV